MQRKIVIAAIIILFVLVPAIIAQHSISSDTANQALTDQESRILSLVNSTREYDYDLQLERITLDHEISGYSFRSSGSPGANQSAQWIKSQFETLGLNARLESYEFTNWYLPTEPTLVVDLDGNASTVDDQTIIRSFQAAHYSWPTPQEGTTGQLVFLPLPANLTAFTLPTASTRFTPLSWNDVNVTGKIVVIGMEVNWNPQFSYRFEDLINTQHPVALIYTYWYDWMGFTPPMYNSMGGHSRWGQRLPIGWIDHQDGLWIRNAASSNATAVMKIPAVIENGTNYNVVTELKGATNAEKKIVISGHYDTVMDAGFCDNGAGTAGVIELARVFTEVFQRGIYTPAQTLVFICFTGEELGSIGSIEYVKQHEAEMGDISAVINLDSIGQDTLQVTETLPDDKGLEIDEIVLKAAKDLGVVAELANVGGSDQETFRNPISATSTMKIDWNINPGIDNVTRVRSATMLSSLPLLYEDLWNLGTPGWAHTAYDNSTSTTTLNWTNAEMLGAHTKVAALTIERSLAALYNPFFLEVLTGTGISIVVLAVIMILERKKVKSLLKKAYDEINSYMEAREMAYALILTAFLLFSSFALHARIGRTEATIRGVPTIVDEQYFGYPLEMIALPLGSPTVRPESTLPTLLWTGLFLDISLLFLLSFGVTYLASRLWCVYQSRRLPPAWASSADIADAS